MLSEQVDNALIIHVENFIIIKDICRCLRPELRAVRGRVWRVRAPAHVSRALRCCRGLRRLRPELRRVRGRVRPLHPRVSPEMRGEL